MYDFQPGEPFELFYEGLVEGYSGDPKKAAKKFEDAIKKDPKNPAAHMYHVMMMEFAKESEAKLKNACEEWLKVAETNRDQKQIRRATYSLDYYKADADGKAKMLDEFKKSIQMDNKVFKNELKHLKKAKNE